MQEYLRTNVQKRAQGLVELVDSGFHELQPSKDIDPKIEKWLLKLKSADEGSVKKAAALLTSVKEMVVKKEGFSIAKLYLQEEEEKIRNLRKKTYTINLSILPRAGPVHVNGRGIEVGWNGDIHSYTIIREVGSGSGSEQGFYTRIMPPHGRMLLIEHLIKHSLLEYQRCLANRQRSLLYFEGNEQNSTQKEMLILGGSAIKRYLGKF